MAQAKARQVARRLRGLSLARALRGRLPQPPERLDLVQPLKAIQSEGGPDGKKELSLDPPESGAGACWGDGEVRTGPAPSGSAGGGAAVRHGRSLAATTSGPATSTEVYILVVGGFQQDKQQADVLNIFERIIRPALAAQPGVS